MNNTNTSHQIAATCLVITFILASIAVAEDDATADNDKQETLELITLDNPADVEVDNSESDDEEAGPPLPGQESDLEELHRTFALYKSAVANNSYDEADTLAKRMVELAIGLFGLDSHESAKALTNLGLVQQKNKDYESAVLNFTAAIGIIERIEDRLNSELVNPLRGLGAAQLGSGRPDLAKRAFDRAVHVTHVNEGPHNLLQIRILEDLAETYLSVGETSEALDVHQFIYNLEARNADLKSEEIIPALERQAEWLHRMSIYEKERITWRRIINILEDSRGKKDLSLIEPLTKLGTSYLYISNFQAENFSEGSVASGDTYLKRAIRILESNPDAPWSTMQKSIVTLGDYYTLSGRATKANRIYKEAWEILSDGEERLQTRANTLEKPHILQGINPPKYYNSTHTEDGENKPENFEIGSIVMSYRVSYRGSTRDVEVIDASPAGLTTMEYSLGRELRNMVHRPRMEDGEAVDTLNQTYTHEFYYRLSDLPQLEGEADAEQGEAVAAEKP